MLVFTLPRSCVLADAAEGLAKGALAPLHDVVRELAGPAASEIGASFGQQLRLWRISRTVRFISKLQERLEPIGINRRSVALKLLLGAVENGAIEEEDELQDLWAALLASAADSREPDVHPSFPDILRQMTAHDAKLVMLIAKTQVELRNTVPYEPVKIIEIRQRSDECDFDPSDAGAFAFYVSAETPYPRQNARAAGRCRAVDRRTRAVRSLHCDESRMGLPSRRDVPSEYQKFIGARA